VAGVLLGFSIPIMLYFSKYAFSCKESSGKIKHGPPDVFPIVLLLLDEKSKKYEIKDPVKLKNSLGLNIRYIKLVFVSS
jgi:hypothetical protein